MARRDQHRDRDDEQKDQASYPDPFQNRDDGFFNPRLNEPRLPSDYDPPASPPADVHSNLPPDFPETDTNLEESEVYDEGTFGATDVDAQEETRPLIEAEPLEPVEEKEEELALDSAEELSFLDIVDYPCSKNDLVERAEQQGASEAMVAKLRGLSEGTFDSPADVTKNLGDI